MNMKELFDMRVITTLAVPYPSNGCEMDGISNNRNQFNAGRPFPPASNVG